MYIDSGYVVSVTPHTILYWSFWNFAHVSSMVWRCACGLDVILALIFVTFFTDLRFYESVVTVGTLWGNSSYNPWINFCHFFHLLPHQIRVYTCCPIRSGSTLFPHQIRFYTFFPIRSGSTLVAPSDPGLHLLPHQILVYTCCPIRSGVTVSFFPPPVFPRGRIRPAHFFPGEETD